MGEIGIDNITGKNSISSKQYNRGLILKLIVTGACRTRIELSRMTRLTKMTVTNIIAELIRGQIIVECEEELTAACGRKPIILRISEQAPKVIGLLIFRDRIETVLCDMAMGVIASERIDFKELTEEQLIRHSCRLIDRLVEKEKHILGIGAAVIGPVDLINGVILNPPRFYGIQNVKVLEFLKQRYAYPVFLDHDNNSAALAEKLFGTGKNEQDFIFLGISNGIGSGVISNGEVYHNRRGFAPELGHVSIDCHGDICPCGNRGCLEMYAGTYVVLEKLRREVHRDLDFKDFCKMEGCECVDRIFVKMVFNIGAALVSSVNILHPELIILGHDCVDWNDRYVDMLEDIINDKKLVHDHMRIPVRKAYFGRNAQLIGAAANVVNQAFKGGLLF